MADLPSAADLTWLICRFVGPNSLPMPGPQGMVIQNLAEIEVGVTAEMASRIFGAVVVVSHPISAFMVVGSPRGSALAPMMVNMRNVAFMTTMPADAVTTLVARLRNAEAVRKGPQLIKMPVGGAA